MPVDSPPPLERYDAVLREAGIDAIRYRSYLERLFSGVPLRGRRVLDVGGGSGFISFWVAMQGGQTTCLEPSADGSNPHMSASFRRLAAALADLEVTLDPRSFQAVGPQDAHDVVLVHNAVNHLDEKACVALPDDEDARRTYARIFGELRAITRPGGHLLVADCSRRNIFGDLRVRNPFVPDIEWHLHHQPSLWRAFAADAGFVDPEIRWNAMTRTGRVGEILLSNALGAYLTQSHFTLRMRSPVA